MPTTEESLREQNDVLRARIQECLEANTRANLVIASMADEQKEILDAALKVTTWATLEHLMKQKGFGYPMPTLLDRCSELCPAKD